MSEQNQRDVQAQSRLESFDLIIEDFKEKCSEMIEKESTKLTKAIEYIKNRGMFANWASPDDDEKTSAELNIKLAKETIRFCDVLKERIREMRDSPDHRHHQYRSQLFGDIYDLLQNNLSELESERSTSRERTFWIDSTKNLVTALLQNIPHHAKDEGEAKARSKIMSNMQEQLIGACESYVTHYDEEIKNIRRRRSNARRLNLYDQWEIEARIECIQLINELKKSLSTMEDDDDARLILAHYNEKVKQDTSHEKPIFASIRENDDERAKRKVAQSSVACKRLIMASIYDVFKRNDGIVNGDNAANAANAVNAFITKTLLRFRDMHEKLIRERKAQYGNEPALAVVNMKLTGINEILDLIESFRKQLDYRVSNELQQPVGDNKPQDYATINRALKTVNAFLKQMSTRLSQSSKETEDAKLNPIKNIVVFLNEVKKIIVEQKHAILKWFDTHQSDETDTSPEDLRKLVQDDDDQDVRDGLVELLPTGEKSTNMREVDGGRKKRKRTGVSGKKRGRSIKKRKSTTRRK